MDALGLLRYLRLSINGTHSGDFVQLDFIQPCIELSSFLTQEQKMLSIY